MRCAIDPFLMAHQWRSPKCAIEPARLREKHGAKVRAIAPFPTARRWRMAH